MRAAGRRARRSSDVRLMAFDPRWRVITRRRAAVVLRGRSRGRPIVARLRGTSDRRLRSDRFLVSPARLDASLAALGCRRGARGGTQPGRFSRGRGGDLRRRSIAGRRLCITRGRLLDFLRSGDRVAVRGAARYAGLPGQTRRAGLGTALRLGRRRIGIVRGLGSTRWRCRLGVWRNGSRAAGDDHGLTRRVQGLGINGDWRRGRACFARRAAAVAVGCGGLEGGRLGGDRFGE